MFDLRQRTDTTECTCFTWIALEFFCFFIPLPRATKTIIQITAKLKASSNLRDTKLRGGDQGALRCNTRALFFFFGETLRDNWIKSTWKNNFIVIRALNHHKIYEAIFLFCIHGFENVDGIRKANLDECDGLAISGGRLFNLFKFLLSWKCVTKSYWK